MNDYITIGMSFLASTFKNQNEEPYKLEQTIKRTFVIHQYLQTLQLFGKMENNYSEKNALSLNAEDFIKERILFDNDLKKASFYLGCAAEMVLQAQRDDLNSEPFKHKLNGLNIRLVQI